jgi:hypothetical protein
MPGATTKGCNQAAYAHSCTLTTNSQRPTCTLPGASHIPYSTTSPLTTARDAGSSQGKAGSLSSLVLPRPHRTTDAPSHAHPTPDAHPTPEKKGPCPTTKLLAASHTPGGPACSCMPTRSAMHCSSACAQASSAAAKKECDVMSKGQQRLLPHTRSRKCWPSCSRLGAAQAPASHWCRKLSRTPRQAPHTA